LTENAFQCENFSFPDVQERTGGLRKFQSVPSVLTMPLPLSDIYGTVLTNYQVYNTYCRCVRQNHTDCASELLLQIGWKRLLLG